MFIRVENIFIAAEFIAIAEFYLALGRHQSGRKTNVFEGFSFGEVDLDTRRCASSLQSLGNSSWTCDIAEKFAQQNGSSGLFLEVFAHRLVRDREEVRIEGLAKCVGLSEQVPFCQMMQRLHTTFAPHPDNLLVAQRVSLIHRLIEAILDGVDHVLGVFEFNHVGLPR